MLLQNVSLHNKVILITGAAGFEVPICYVAF